MIWEDAEQQLIDYFKGRWEDMNPDVPVNWPNGEKVTGPTYLRLRINNTYAKRVAVGGPLRISAGEVVINTFTSVEVGTKVISQLNKDITEIWDTAKENGLSGAIHLGAPGPLPGIRDPNVPTLWRSGISVPFTIDHTPASA